MTSPPPLVSVLMTAHNREAFLAQAIESVLASSFRDFELIVVDDGSTDRSMEIAEAYAGRDPRVFAHVNRTNLGDYPNRNRAASLARGTYLKYLDSDDLIYPWGLSAMVSCIERFPNAALGLSENAEGHRPHPVQLEPREAYLEHFLRRDLFGRAPGSAIIRRDAFEEVGGFSGKRYVGDTELWFKLAARRPIVTMPRDLVWDRTHGAQEKSYERGADDVQAIRHQLIVDALTSPDCPLDEDEKAAAHRSISRRYSRDFWRLAIRHRAPGAALRFRRGVSLEWKDVFSAIAPKRSGASSNA